MAIDTYIYRFVLVVTFLTCFSIAAPSFQFDFGTIQGTDVTSKTSNRLLYAYLGIPYAQPPVGTLRFRPPLPFTGISPTDVISSDTFRAACAQYPATLGTMSEDCLYLNIWTPSDNSVVPNKVMIFIHGGGYTVGDATHYIPTDLVADYDVIVVTMQYRLGPFGFLSSGDQALSGNNGLRDQLLAIKWVKDNIGRFNGDPSDITVFGESAGSTSVSLLTLSPLSKGLFTKVIMQSGTAVSPWAIVTSRKAHAIFNELAEQTDCKPWFYLPVLHKAFHSLIVDCFRAKPADVFKYRAAEKLDGESLPLLSSLVDFAPVVDGDVIPQEPWRLLNNKTYLQEAGILDRKYFAGITNNEGLVLYHVKDIMSDEEFVPLFTTPSFFEPCFETLVREEFPFTAPPSAVDLVRFQYSYPRDENDRPDIQGILDLLADSDFVLPTLSFANALTKASGNLEMYIYLFDHYPELANGNTQLKGTSHALDLAYLFDENAIWVFLIPFQNVYSASSRPMFNIYRQAITSFAHSGKPSWDGVSIWPRYDVASGNFGALSVNPEIRQHIYPKRVALWKQFLPRLRKGFFPF